MAVSNVVTTIPRAARKQLVTTPTGLRSAGLLVIAGAALTIAGFLDLLLAWYPAGIGNPEWEFGTISGTLNSLPLLTVGLVLTLAGAHESERVWGVRLVAVLFAVLGLFIVGSGILYVMDVPLALKAVTNPLARSGLVKAIIKASGLIVVYAVVFSWIAVASWRRTTVR